MSSLQDARPLKRIRIEQSNDPNISLQHEEPPDCGMSLTLDSATDPIAQQPQPARPMVMEPDFQEVEYKGQRSGTNRQTPIETPQEDETGSYARASDDALAVISEDRPRQGYFEGRTPNRECSGIAAMEHDHTAIPPEELESELSRPITETAPRLEDHIRFLTDGRSADLYHALTNTIQQSEQCLATLVRGCCNDIWRLIMGQSQAIRMAAKIRVLKAQVLAQQDTIRKLEDQLDRSGREVSLLREENETTREKNGILIDEYDTQTQKLAERERELYEARGVHVDKTPDAVIEGLWKQLSFSIRNLAGSLARMPPNVQLNDETRQQMNRVIPNAGRLLQHESCRDSILQAYLWRILTDLIGNGRFPTWQGRLGSRFKSMRTTLISHTLQKEDALEILPLIGPWLAQGPAILEQKLPQSDDAELKELVDRYMNNFVPFLAGYSAEDVQMTRDEFTEICKLGTSLDTMILGSKAVIRILWKGDMTSSQRALQFIKDTMEAVAHRGKLTESSEVAFFVSPALVKHGNADGRHYENKKILAKAKVVCE